MKQTEAFVLLNLKDSGNRKPSIFNTLSFNTKWRMYVIVSFFLMTTFTVSAQYLYPEHFLNKVPNFALDDGRLGVTPLPDAWERMYSAFNAEVLKQAKGEIIVQILVDSTGRAQLLSADNKSNVTSKDLQLEKAVNNSLWKPTELESYRSEMVSVSYSLSFSNGSFDGKAVSPFETYSNPKEPITDGSNPKELSYTFDNYNRYNGKIPSKVAAMSRGVTVDGNGTVWMGTDNGLVSLSNGKTELYTYENSPLTSPIYDPTQTSTIFSMITDHDNAVWVVQGWNVFRIKDDQWTRFDTLNSPVYWGRRLLVDKDNNFWITSWDGICQYDGSSWTVLDSTNSGIPSNKVLSFYIDRQDRKWVGTFFGNAMFDGEKWIDLRSEKSPLGQNYISNAYQDKQGNVWFTFYADRNMHKGGLYMLDTKGNWHQYAPKWTKGMERESANDMLYDESKDQIWISVNTIGLFMYDVKKDRWEVYTPENSKLPSEYVMQLCQDKDGNIWGATFNGFFKLIRK